MELALFRGCGSMQDMDSRRLVRSEAIESEIMEFEARECREEVLKL
jgi:hypothetical protein